ncbi:hypothetical protein [Pseudovibrio sp. Tun.PSC04-5.I4]|uniref:hypothetical protein n=1 Tax=Pseudovibrio sp. Tun.PSC04-5.I4 TaxID=1798213 RepID=UPI0008916246|nr:hypothetical protein [Pseudovibrio sp. Tun.PSC04-5.I4]SDR08004.1 hypothetical protein SAMN04515695_2648 [Pseudovibrio sp. Tun.PSC04-5.I4]
MGQTLDYMRKCAESELAAIQNLWADQGYVVTGSVTYRIGPDGTGHYAVTTNLINGLPQDIRAAHLEQMMQSHARGRMM